LTNTAAGIPAQLTAIALQHRSARVAARFPEPLQVRALDAGGNPVPGAAVTFTLGAASAGACGASAAASASFVGGGATATATTDSSGLATSPALTANTVAGSFTATASVASGGGGGGAESAGGKAGGPTVTPASFSLVNLAGKPTKIAPGVGSTQSTPAGAAFPIRLAVTVTDAEKNPVRGALVTFSAPAAGASGRFAGRSSIGRSRGSHRRRAHVSYAHTVKVKTGACGITVAPPFTAGHRQGGYIVTAGVEPAKPAAFALVNEAP
jgi:hypothetical protein